MCAIENGVFAFEWKVTSAVARPLAHNEERCTGECVGQRLRRLGERGFGRTRVSLREARARRTVIWRT